MSKTKLFEISNLKKYYTVMESKGVKNVKHKLKAVDDVSFDIYKGEILGIVGESGSGKSTIGRCILDLEKTTAGEVRYRGVKINNLHSRLMKSYRKDMQMVFQNPLASFNPKKTIGSALAEIGKVYGMGRQETQDRVLQVLEDVDLTEEVLNRMPNQLSGGQLQRLAIARALIINPEFIVADEPVSALDVSVQAQILNLLLKLKKEKNLTILFISHDLNVVERVCDRVAVVYLGKIVELADKKALFHNMFHPYSKALMEAKPKDHPLEKKERVLLEGDIPSALDLGEGCRFAKRCRYCKEGACDSRTPVLRELDFGHYAACQFPLYEQKEESHNK